MIKKGSLELKVGLFVLLALCALTLLVVKAGDFYLKPGYTLRFIFDSVSGVDKGTPVCLAGVPVGEVKDIRVIRTAENRSQVELLAWVERGAFIEEDAKVRINALGLLGEKYIEILPGSQGAATLSDGSLLNGKSPIGMETLTEAGDRLIRKMETAMDSVNTVVGDERFRTDVRNTFGNASQVSGNLVEISADLKDTIKSAQIVMARLRDGEGTIGYLLKNDTVAKDLEGFVKEIRKNPWKLLKRD